MNLIEDTIQKVEKLYENITGKDIQGAEASRQPISAEIDPIMLLDVRMNQLMGLMETPVVNHMLRPTIPPMSAWESESHFLIRLDLPGVEKTDIDITVRGNHLLVNARRKPMSIDAGFQPRLVESNSGIFHRAIVLPTENLTSEISSNLIDGVLEISIPKQAAQTSKSTASKKSKAQ